MWPGISPLYILWPFHDANPPTRLAFFSLSAQIQTAHFPFCAIQNDMNQKSLRYGLIAGVTLVRIRRTVHHFGM
jgi:hypothetical protein